jgi:hypothetical protein
MPLNIVTAFLVLEVLNLSAAGDALIDPLFEFSDPRDAANFEFVYSPNLTNQTDVPEPGSIGLCFAFPLLHVYSRPLGISVTAIILTKNHYAADNGVVPGGFLACGPQTPSGVE